MFKRISSLIICISILILILSVLPIHGEAHIYENVLRLHVIANSDSEEDQALKLKVRDKILEYTEALLYECASRSEAEQLLKARLGEITAMAELCIENEGYGYPVKLALSYEEYPTKSYESCCFPSGEYLSLQVKIGEAQGKNWWCVLFPPLCLSAAEDSSASLQAGLTADQYNVITEGDNIKYKIRFKLLETIEKAVK